jgi:hypothetical protein
VALMHGSSTASQLVRVSVEMTEHAAPRSMCSTNKLSPIENEKMRAQSSGGNGSGPDESMAPKRERDADKFSV